MCNVVVINRGEKEIETPRQFQAHFGFPAEKDTHYTEVTLDLCLCQCCLEETFKQNNIPFKFDGSDYYVGELDKLGF